MVGLTNVPCTEDQVVFKRGAELTVSITRIHHESHLTHDNKNYYESTFGEAWLYKRARTSIPKNRIISRYRNLHIFNGFIEIQPNTLLNKKFFKKMQKFSHSKLSNFTVYCKKIFFSYMMWQCKTSPQRRTCMTTMNKVYSISVNLVMPCVSPLIAKGEKR